jgi:hypothetical protein
LTNLAQNRFPHRFWFWSCPNIDIDIDIHFDNDDEIIE